MKSYKYLTALIVVIIITACGKKTEETKPIRKDVTETIFASGVLEAKNTYSLTAQTDGYLEQINFDEGDIIPVGKVMAVIDNKENNFNTQSAEALYKIAKSNTYANAPALLQAKNTIVVNQTKMEQDKLQYQRYQKLWNENSVAKIDFENAELQYKTSKANYENAIENYKLLQQQAEQSVISNKVQKNINEVLLNHNQIKAVVSGKVYKKYKQIGDYVKKGDIIAQIGEANIIYAKVNIDEGNIDKVKLGQKAVVQLNTNKNKIYEGQVAEIYPSFDESSQSFICKIALPKLPNTVIINTQLQANIIVSSTKNALVIPRNYIDFGGNVQIKGKKEKTKVTTKFISSLWVEIIDGIDENTTLLTEDISDNKMNTSEVGSQIQ